MKKSAFALIMVFILCQAALAQNDTLVPAFKLPAPVAVSDSLRSVDVSFDYSIFNRPYADLYDFTPIEALRMETVGPNRRPVFYARLGTQYPWLPSAELYLQSRNKQDFGVGLYGRHNSFIGSVPDAVGDGKISVRNGKNEAGGGLTYDWATGEFMFDAKYGYDSFAYKADEAEVSGRKREIGFTANINSAYEEDNSLYYDITAGYTYSSFTHQREALSLLNESFLHLHGYVGASFEIHRIYVNMNIEFANYSKLKELSSGVVELSPIYDYSRGRLSAKLGAKFGSCFGIASEESKADNAVGAQTTIFPDVDIRLTMVDKALWLHALVSGGNDSNPFSKMAGDCPVLLPESEFITGRRNVDASLAVESVISGRLSLNLIGGYTIHTNKLTYCPVMEDQGPKRVKTAYFNVNDWSAGLELFWKSGSLTLGGTFRYDKYSDRESKEKVTEFPSVSASALARYNYRERVIASLDLSYRGETSGSIYGAYTVAPVLDVNINVNYIVNRNFSIYAKCGNLLNRRNQYVPLYVEPGRNIGGGVCVNF